MKRLLFGAMPLALLAGSIGVAEARDAAPESPTLRVAICHKTSSARRPYQRIVVTTARARRAHVNHPADIVPAPRSCPQSVLSPTAGGTAINVTLRGVAEQPALGDADGSGTATLRLRAGQGQVCYSLNVQGVVLPAAGAHIHVGSVEESGPIVVQLNAPASGGGATGCAAAGRPLVQDILRNRDRYYVNVHTTEFPGGAVRAQLAQPATAPILAAPDMTGAKERPNPGDADGAGAAAFLIFPDNGRICYTLAVRGIVLPATGAHIHRGGAEVAGPVVVPFTNPDAGGTSSGCVSADPALLRDIAQNPANYYANIHSREFLPGAVRAQLVAG
jgi:CHRD domain